MPTDEYRAGILTTEFGPSRLARRPGALYHCGMYRLLILIHILAGITWIGGGLTQQLAVIQARKRGGSAEADAQITGLEWMERFIYVPAPILVLLTGVTMVIVDDGWSFSQMWVYLALGLIVVAGVLGGAVGGQLEKQMTDLRTGGEVSGPAYAETLRKTLNTGWLELAVMVALVTLMVYKPGL